MRWDDYFMRCGSQHTKFWKKYLQPTRDLLYVVASGFDLRMCDGAESIMRAGGSGKRDCRLVKFYGATDSTALSYGDLVESNILKLEQLFGKQQIKTVKLAPQRNRDVALQRSAAGLVVDEDYRTYTDIIVDISSMPTQIFFPMLGKIVQRLSGTHLSGGRNPNLFIIVSEDPAIDRAITKSGLDEEASFIYGFFGDMDLQAKESGPTIWIPVLGENRAEELKRIHQKINPAETCPVIPSPSSDPRRGDHILLEYRNVLRRIGIDPQNMIYASEQNPFDVYRQIRDAVIHYHRVLKPVGTYRFAISPMSSKLMSIGAFLAAHELTYKMKIRQGIGIVGAARYKFDKPSERCEPNLFTLWICGDCYEQ